ncbi:ABC transporter permease [Microbacterium lushaniae]|nr:ABC transporter permease [Microbacterium lushaniae]KAA9157246.1 ABC transporter permease [Microbacterium lushaniae]
MSPSRLGALIRLELTQSLRSVAWYVLLGVFALILLIVTGLAVAASALNAGSGGWLFSLQIFLVLLLVLLVSPTLSGNSVNGERDAATLAPMQVTLATTGEILLGKFLAAWIAGLAFLVVALPFLIVATLAGDLEPATIGTSLAILVVEVGVVAGIGVGLSAVIARPLFSVASTYLVVAALTVGTIVAFGLGATTSRVEVTVTERYYTDEGPPCAPGEDPDEYGCVEDPLSECGPWQTYTHEAPRTDHVWWILAANPFVVLADATPTTFSPDGYPQDLFGQISWTVRSAQIPPMTEVRNDFCDASAWQNAGPLPSEQIDGTAPSWFVGLAVQVLATAGLLAWGWQRTRTPARTLPPGTRIA